MRRLSTFLAKWMPRDATRRRSAAVWLSINRPIAGRARRGNPRQSPSRVREFAPLFEATSSFFPVSLEGDSFPLFSSHTLREQTRCSGIREGKGSPGQKHCPTSRNIGCLEQAPHCKLLSPEIFSRQKLGTCFRYFLQVDVFIVRNGMFEKIEGCLDF